MRATVLAGVVACNFAAIACAGSPTAPPAALAAAFAPTTRPAADPDFHVDLQSAVGYLASEELEGRYIGTPGIEKASNYIADAFAKLGLQPLPGLDGYFQPLAMVTGVKLAGDTSLAAGKGNDWTADVKPKVGNTYQPLNWSSEGAFDGPVAFVGYGISSEKQKYDDYAGIDAKGKVVLAMRFEPHDAKGKSRFADGKDRDWSMDATILQKANVAAAHGAAAVLLVTPPLHHDKDDAIMPFARTFPFEQASIPVIQVSRTLADAMLKAGGAKPLADLQAGIDANATPSSTTLADVAADGKVAFDKTQKFVRNVAAMLPGEKADEYVVIGAHYDHLGHGGPGSLAPLSKQIHPGADDNASGTVAMLKLADHFAHAGRKPDRTLIFIAFTGEEEGLIGSAWFVNHPPVDLKRVIAMLNLDMVGRMRGNKLAVGGAGTAAGFEKILKDADQGSPIEITAMGKGGLGPSDHTSFAIKKVPVLFFFSGLHLDYHRPSDTADKINYQGMQDIIDLGAKVVEAMSAMPREAYVGKFDASGMMHMSGDTGASGGNRVMLGVVPDYSDESVKGVPISGTTPDSPADRAGLKGGDVIVGVGGKPLNNLMALSQILARSKPGDAIRLRVDRHGEMIDVEAKLVERKAPPPSPDDEEQLKDAAPHGKAGASNGKAGASNGKAGAPHNKADDKPAAPGEKPGNPHGD